MIRRLNSLVVSVVSLTKVLLVQYFFCVCSYFLGDGATRCINTSVLSYIITYTPLETVWAITAVMCDVVELCLCMQPR